MKRILLLSSVIALMLVLQWYLKAQELSSIESNQSQTYSSTKPMAKVQSPNEEKSTSTKMDKLKLVPSEFQAIDSARSRIEKDPHGTPIEIMAAGEKLGEIAEIEERYPERREEVLALYKKCYLDQDVLTVTRVQCLKRYKKSLGLSEKDTGEILDHLPLAVQKLYKKSLSL